jgi:hypothetical protein
VALFDLVCRKDVLNHESYSYQSAEVMIIEPKVFGDERGFFFESFNAKKFAELTGVDVEFVQDNHSLSAKNILRGLHYQIKQAQGKLVRVVTGEVFDVAVDIRKSSPRFWPVNAVSFCPQKISVSSGSRLALHMVLLCSAIKRNSSIKPQITGRRNTNAHCNGMILQLVLNGRFRANR